MMRDSINKALKQWRHINDDDRKSLVVYGFTQDGMKLTDLLYLIYVLLKKFFSRT